MREIFALPEKTSLKQTADQKITFTAYGTSWDFISFSASSTNSILDNVIASGGGYFYNPSVWEGVVHTKGADLIIRDSLFENNIIGIGLVNADFSAQTTNVTVRNNWIGIYVEGSCPDLSGITISNSQIYDIWPTACQN